MQWFKHDSNASSDARIKKLILKHGAVGYAIYFHCLELISSDISDSNISFELEHDSEIIADNLKIKGTSEMSGVSIVEKTMKDIIELGLFNESNGHVFCFKLLKRLDSSMTSNAKLRMLITNGKQSHDKVMMRHDKVMQEENRIEQTRIDENRVEQKEADKSAPRQRFSVPTIEQIKDVMQNDVEALKFFNYYESNGWMVGKNKMKKWQAAVTNWKSNIGGYGKKTTYTPHGIGFDPSSDAQKKAHEELMAKYGEK